MVDTGGLRGLKWAKALASALRRSLNGLAWLSAPTPNTAGATLAQDLGLPRDVVEDIFDRTTADLRSLETGDIDARSIIDRAVNELAQLGYQSRPFEEAAMECYLQKLPERDYQILLYFKQNRRHGEIAELMGTDVDSVRDSLVKTYTDLRMRMITTNPLPTSGAADSTEQSHLRITEGSPPC